MGGATLQDDLLLSEDEQAHKLNVKLDATLQSDMIMTADSAALTPSGATGLTIKSTNAYVDVESVRFTDNTIGIADDPDLLTLTNAALAWPGR